MQAYSTFWTRATQRVRDQHQHLERNTTIAHQQSPVTMPAPTAGPADASPALAQLSDKVSDHFQQAQHSVANHRKNIVSLLRLHRASAIVTEETPRGTRLVGEKTFNDSFLGCLNRVLGIKKGVPNADRCLKFVAAYSSYAQEQFRLALADVEEANGEIDDDEDTPATRFTVILLKHLLRGFGAKNKAVRLRCCQTVVLLINGLESIDDDLYDSLKNALLVRLRDKESSVRVQAVIALAKLQVNEEDELGQNGEESVTSLILSALRHDPSTEVRRAALFNLTPTMSTLPYILERLRDVDTLNRRCVFLGSLSNTVLLQPGCQVKLSKHDWAHVIKTGLGERESSVLRAVKKLIASWVDADGGKSGAERILDRFDPNEHADTALLALKAAFEMRDSLLDTVTFDHDFWQQLSPQKAIVAQAFAEHCKSLGAPGEKRMEEVMPLVTELAFRIQASWGNLLQQLELTCDGEQSDASSLPAYQTIVQSLLYVSMHVDYGDEIGRRKMFGLIRDMVSTPLLPDALVYPCLDVLRKLSAGQKDFVRIIVEIVQEIEDVIESNLLDDNDDQEEAEVEEIMGESNEEQNDPQQVAEQSKIDARRLIIVSGMLERISGGMQENTAMHGLVSQLIAPAVKSKDDLVRERGLKSLALCCILDPKLALSTFGLFLQQTEQGDGSIRKTSIEIVFDLLLTHGIAFLCSPQIQQAGGDHEAVHAQLVNFLLSLLEDDDLAIQAIAAEGMAKLMLSGVVDDDDALRSLVLVYMSPETSENQALRQCLSYFLPLYCYRSSANQRRLQRVFIPVLDVLTEVFYERDETQEMVTPLQIGVQLLDWSDPAKALYEVKDDEAIHIDIAIEIVQSLYMKEAKEDRKVLCQLLGKLALPEEEKLRSSPDDAGIVSALFILMGTLQKVRNLEDVTSSRNLTKFQLLCKKTYPATWEQIRHRDIRTAPEFDGVRVFINECGYHADRLMDIGDDGTDILAEARKPSSRSVSTATRRTVSNSTSRTISTSRSGRIPSSTSQNRVKVESDEEPPTLEQSIVEMDDDDIEMNEANKTLNGDAFEDL